VLKRQAIKRREAGLENNSAENGWRHRGSEAGAVLSERLAHAMKRANGVDESSKRIQIVCERLPNVTTQSGI